jgi:hypothetical protein
VADAPSGRLSLSASADSGVHGDAPSPYASSVANGDVGLDASFGGADHLTATFHVRIADLARTASGDGRAVVVLWASAECDGCLAPRPTTLVATHNGDVTLVVTLSNDSGVNAVRLVLGSSAEARLDCHDFCAAASGTADASATLQLLSVELAS